MAEVVAVIIQAGSKDGPSADQLQSEFRRLTATYASMNFAASQMVVQGQGETVSKIKTQNKKLAPRAIFPGGAATLLVA